MQKLKVLDLFSGIGGFSLGLERTNGFETVAFCEIEPYCQKVLKKHWPEVPIYEDVRKLDGGIDADVITGGYPCQPFSNAGKRRGENDDRHLWPQMLRVIKRSRPRWLIAENVAGHISMGLDTVLSDLERENYSWWTFVIPACALDAKHRRDRVWIVANSNSHRLRVSEISDFGSSPSPLSFDYGQEISLADPSRFQPGWEIERTERERVRQSGESIDVADAEGNSSRRLPKREEPEITRSSCSSEDVPDTECLGRRQMEQPVIGRTEAERSTDQTQHSSSSEWWPRWEPEPHVGRVANGVPHRVDRLRTLGNAVVPQIPEMIGYAILEAEAEIARLKAMKGKK